jgi:hypothetical protein
MGSVLTSDSEAVAATAMSGMLELESLYNIDFYTYTQMQAAIYLRN